MENKTPDIKIKESAVEEILQYENLIDPGNEHHHHADKEEDADGNSPASDAPVDEEKKS